MEIRFYQEQDFNAAVQIFAQLASYYLGASRSADEEIATNLKDNILGPDSGVKLILAFDSQNQVIGLSTISLLYPAPYESCQLFIKELFVLQSHQNQGVGKAIMVFIANYAQSQNCSRLDLTVDADNEQAIGLYNSLGITSLEDKIYLRAERDVISKLASGQTNSSSK